MLVPQRLASLLVGEQPPDRLLIRTDVGAAEIVAAQVGIALSATSPDVFAVETLSAPTATRDAVLGDTQSLLVALGVVSLVVGGIGIANSTLVAVMERVPEIGLRRALGARRRDILAQFLLSSVVVGVLGAVAGALLGAFVTAAVARAQGWPPTMEPWVILAAPGVGASIGLISGAYPAFKAAWVEPIAALRSAVS